MVNQGKIITRRFNREDLVEDIDRIEALSLAPLDQHVVCQKEVSRRYQTLAMLFELIVFLYLLQNRAY